MVEWFGVLVTLVCGSAGATPAWLALRKVPKHEVPAELFKRSSDLLRELHYSPGEKPDLADSASCPFETTSDFLRRNVISDDGRFDSVPGRHLLRQSDRS